MSRDEQLCVSYGMALSGFIQALFVHSVAFAVVWLLFAVLVFIARRRRT